MVGERAGKFKMTGNRLTGILYSLSLVMCSVSTNGERASPAHSKSTIWLIFNSLHFVDKLLQLFS